MEERTQRDTRRGRDIHERTHGGTHGRTYTKEHIQSNKHEKGKTNTKVYLRRDVQYTEGHTEERDTRKEGTHLEGHTRRDMHGGTCIEEHTEGLTEGHKRRDAHGGT